MSPDLRDDPWPPHPWYYPPRPGSYGWMSRGVTVHVRGRGSLLVTHRWCVSVHTDPNFDTLENRGSRDVPITPLDLRIRSSHSWGFWTSRRTRTSFLLARRDSKEVSFQTRRVWGLDAIVHEVSGPLDVTTPYLGRGNMVLETCPIHPRDDVKFVVDRSKDYKALCPL